MILPDTNIWIDHFRKPVDAMAAGLNQRLVYCHSYVIAELTLGALAGRPDIIAELTLAPRMRPPSHNDVMYVITTHKLGGSGIGYVDACLVTSCLLHGDCKLWTRDKRLQAAASNLGIDYAAGFAAG